MATISINGLTISGGSISVRNGKVIVDGKEISTEEKIINITVAGNIDKIDADACGTISVTGEVGNVKTMSGDVDIKGNVKGSVSTMSGDVDCGHIEGNVSTMSGDIKNRK